MDFSRGDARALMLAAQGLTRAPARYVAGTARYVAGKGDVLATIQRMGALQIDTIHVIARSPYFVLWSRLCAHEPQWLNELPAEHRLFEY